jgi:RecB family exonuclease
MDLLFRDGAGEWEVVDYKTASPPAAGDEAVRGGYALQLGLYALAAARWLGTPPDRWAVYYLGEGVYEPHAVTEGDLGPAAAEAEEILATSAGGRYDSGSDARCRTCQLRGVCEPSRRRSH